MSPKFNALLARPRARLRPYRRILTFLFLSLCAVLAANHFLEWGLLGSLEGKWQALALLSGLLWYVFACPDGDELKSMREN